MNSKKDITVAFTGHRTYQGEADEALREHLQTLYDGGYRRFLTGMAWGFDLAAGEAVMALQQRYGDVELVAALPYDKFRERFHDEDLARYDKVIASADEVVFVSQQRGAIAYRMRNDFLVDNASAVVAWWDGSPKGGTAYTIKRALKRCREVRNLCPPAQQELF